MNTLLSSQAEDYRAVPEDIVHVHAPLAVANDYDSTLGVTGRLPSAERAEVEGAMGLLLEVASSDSFRGCRQKVIDAWQAAEDSGGSFDSLSYIESLLPPEAREQFRRAYEDNAPGIPLLYPDSESYLAILNQAPAVPNFTLTYGNQAWQELKTRTSRIPGHIEVTSRKKKGPVLESMRSEDGTFQLVAADEANRPVAIVHAASMLLVDDKPTSFDGLPDDCSGVLIDRGEGRRKSQEGTIDPGRITVVRSLAEISIPPVLRPAYGSATTETIQRASRFVPLGSFASYAAA